MIETLYRPGLSITDKSEHYILVLASRAASEGKRFTFMAEHGMWDEESGRFSIRPVSVYADENLTWDDAHKLYQDTRSRLAQKGFSHSCVHRHRRVGMHETPAAEREPVLA
jgi:hypothetical protein